MENMGKIKRDEKKRKRKRGRKKERKRRQPKQNSTVNGALNKMAKEHVRGTRPDIARGEKRRRNKDVKVCRQGLL
jgi:hypothetical protein